jgi:hypothetical protein
MTARVPAALVEALSFEPRSDSTLSAAVPIKCVIECVRSAALARPDWSRKLPRPLKLPTITTLRTLGNIRALLGNLPAERRKQNTWRHVADRLQHAARGGDINDAVTSLRLVLQLERVPCLPQ